MTGKTSVPATSTLPVKECQDWRPHRAHSRKLRWSTDPWWKIFVCPGVPDED